MVIHVDETTRARNVELVDARDKRDRQIREENSRETTKTSAVESSRTVVMLARDVTHVFVERVVVAGSECAGMRR
jgi:hypothetical protein|tara:strand:- start:1112 stop:1336 length:225 start_codon:yes stop_codon:yes gene_type:complete